MSITNRLRAPPVDVLSTLREERFTNDDGDNDILGISSVGHICTDSKATSVNIDKWSGKDPSFLGCLISHELGHNLGMVHDKTGFGCPCKYLTYLSLESLISSVYVILLTGLSHLLLCE